MRESPAELRAVGFLLAKMGAHICRLADAEEGSDRAAASEEARGILLTIAAMIDMAAIPKESMGMVTESVRGIAEEYLAADALEKLGDGITATSGGSSSCRRNEAPRGAAPYAVEDHCRYRCDRCGHVINAVSSVGRRGRLPSVLAPASAKWAFWNDVVRFMPEHERDCGGKIRREEISDKLTDTTGADDLEKLSTDELRAIHAAELDQLRGTD